MTYAVRPGVYAVGSPTPESPVFVSANYKMSFDALRQSLSGRDGWIMVLDTRGINVWCAAGKGTFGTEEIVGRIEATRLADLVSHRTLILPQLGAPGVAAHEVKRRSGFRVVYGPVRARDIPAFLDAGMEATAAMRRVTFSMGERLVLIPVELVTGVKYAAGVALVAFLVCGLGPGGYSLSGAAARGTVAASLCALAFFGGAAVVPALLPWLPGRAFSVKGAPVGLAVGVAYAYFLLGSSRAQATWLEAAAWLLILPAVAAFTAINFTGATPYTSLSGVQREMRIALPVQIAGVVLGAALLAAARILSS